MCDTACSNSWVSNDLANRLGLHGTALKLTVKGINTEEVVDTKLVELIVTPRDNQAFEPFKVSPYVKENLNVGADVINIKALQETYPHLAVLDPVTYCYGNIEMILGQDVYHAIRPLQYFAADEKSSPFAVRLPIGWVLSGPLPSSSSLVSTCFKANMEQDFEFASQVKSWYDMESYGALKQVDPRSASDARAHEILENTTVHNGKRYDVGMLWAKDIIELPNNYFSALVQLKSLEKRLTKDQTLREKYSSTIKEDLNKGYVVRVKDAHKVESRDNAKEYPEAAKAVLENFYMDNYLDSVESPERALIRSKELVHLLHLGGFKLTKFVSNVPDLADRIDGSAQSTEPKVIVSSKEESMHVLGLKWDHNNDTLVVSRGTNSTITKSLTQRLVLSLVSKVYDPIGLVAPFTVGARLTLKDIWRVNGQSWDDELPKDTVDRFLAWCVELPRLAEITIPRSYFSGPFQLLELHMFGDSSQDVFSAVGFLRAQVTCTSGEIITELAFVLGKARVAPMKVMTVPKLELKAALLAARLKSEICRALTVTVDKVFMWTDSTIVLQWINSTNKHPIFIENRVSEILENTSVDQWNHAAT